MGYVSLTENRKGQLVFVLLLLGFLTVKLAVLLTSLNALYEPEELYRGTVAREIIQGPLMPLWEYLDYKVEYFPGGTLVVGILAVPFFLLFGQTYIALKLVGLSFSLGTLIVWYLFLRRFVSQKAAVIGSLFFIFSVPFYTKTSLVTWGAHPEANLFAVVSLFIFYAIFFKKKESLEGIPDIYSHYKGKFFLLGVVSGFGFWFVQTQLLIMAFLLLAWYGFDLKFLLRKVFLFFCLGFILGFLPGIYHQLMYKAGIFSVNGDNLLAEVLKRDINRVLPKMGLMFAYDLPSSFLFEDFLAIPGLAISYVYYGVFLCSYVWLFWINRHGLFLLVRRMLYPVTLKKAKIIPGAIKAELLLLCYPLFFAFCYGMSKYSISPRPWDDPELWLDYIGYRYMIPVLPFITVIIAIFLDRIWQRRLLRNIALAVVLTTGIIGNIGLITPKDFGRFNQDKGYSYNIIGDKIGMRITDNLREYIKPFDRLSEELKTQFYEGLGAGIAWRMREEAELSEVTSFMAGNISPQYLPNAYIGWGTLYSPEYDEEFAAALVVASAIKEEFRPFFYEGFGRNMGFFDEQSRIAVYMDKVEAAYLPFCYKGLGYAIGFEFKRNRKTQLEIFAFLPAQYLRLLEEGIIRGESDR